MAITIGQAILWFKGSTDDLEQKIGSAKGMIDAFSGQMEKTLADVEKNFSDATKQQVALETAAFTQRMAGLTKSAKSEEQVTAAVEKANIAYQERIKKIQTMNVSEAEIATRMGKASQAYDNQIAKIKASSVASEEFQKKLAAVTTGYENNVKKIMEAEKAEKAKSVAEQAAANRNLGLLQLEAKAMDKALDAKKIKDAEAEWARYGNGVKKAGEAVEAVGRGIEKLGRWMTVAGGAMTALEAFFIKDAAEGEEALAQLDNALKNNENVFNEAKDEEVQASEKAAEAKKKIDENAAESVRKTNESISESLQSLADKAAETTQDFTEKLVEDEQKLQETLLKSQQDYQDKSADAEKKYTETLSALRQEANDLDQEYADKRDERIRTLNESLGAVDQKYAAQRGAIESQMAGASTAQSKAALQRQLDKLGGNQQSEKEKIQSEFDLKEKQEQDAYQKSQQRLNDKINKENRAYQEQTAKMKAEQEKRESDAAKSYEKETAKLREEYTKRQSELDKDRAKIEQKRVEDESAFQRKMQRENQAYEDQYTAIERGEASMTAVVKPSREELLKLSKELSETSVFDDDDLIRAEANALVYDRIGKDIMPRMMQSVADLSARFGNDLTANVKALGRAMQDPENGLKALQKAGVILTAQQKSEIKDLMAQGKLYEAQMKVLDAVQKGVGGSAKAQLATTSGQFQALWRDVKEVGKAVAADFLPAIKSMLEAIRPLLIEFKNWIDKQTNLKEQITEFGLKAVATFKQIWAAFEPVFKNIGKYLEKNPGLFAKVVTAAALLGPAFVTLGPIVMALGTVLTSVAAAITSISAAFITLSPWFPAVGAAIAGLSLGFSQFLVAAAPFAAWFLAFAAAGGIGWMFGTWINEMLHSIPLLGNAIDSVFDKLVSVIEKTKEWLGWAAKSPELGERTKQLQAEGRLPAFADGGIMQKSGLAIVGERGRELVNLSAGSKVYTNRETEGMLSKQNVSMSITIPGMVVRESADIDKLSCALADNVSRKLRQRGLSTI